MAHDRNSLTIAVGRCSTKLVPGSSLFTIQPSGHSSTRGITHPSKHKIKERARARPGLGFCSISKSYNFDACWTEKHCCYTLLCSDMYKGRGFHLSASLVCVNMSLRFMELAEMGDIALFRKLLQIRTER